VVRVAAQIGAEGGGVEGFWVRLAALLNPAGRNNLPVCRSAAIQKDLTDASQVSQSNAVASVCHGGPARVERDVSVKFHPGGMPQVPRSDGCESASCYALGNQAEEIGVERRVLESLSMPAIQMRLLEEVEKGRSRALPRRKPAA